MTRPLWPVPLSLAAVNALGIAVLVFLNSFGLIDWAYDDWTATSSEARQSLIIAGPWTSACAAWLAARVFTARTVIVPALARRRQGSVVLTHVVVMTVFGWCGLIVGLGPVWTDTATGATWGGPDYPVVLTGLVEVGAFVSWGYLLGCLLPGAVSASLAGASGFVATVFASGINGTVVSPTYPFGMVAGLEEPFATSIIRTAFFAASAVAFSYTAHRYVLSRGSYRPSRRLLLSAWPAVLLVVVALTLSGRSITLAEEGHDVEALCTDAGSTTVCVHPARADMLPTLADVVTKVQSAVGPAFDLRSVNDNTLWLPRAPDRANLALQSQDAQGWPSAAAGELAQILTGATTCSSRDEVPGVDDPAVVSEAVAAWITKRAGGEDARGSISSTAAGDLLDQMNGQPPAQITERLESSLPAIRACAGDRASLAP